MQKPHMANRALAAIADCEFRGEVAGSSGFSKRRRRRRRRRRRGNGCRVVAGHGCRPRLARSLTSPVPVRPLALASERAVPPCVETPCHTCTHRTCQILSTALCKKLKLSFK